MGILIKKGGNPLVLQSSANRPTPTSSESVENNIRLLRVMQKPIRHILQTTPMPEKYVKNVDPIIGNMNQESMRNIERYADAFGKYYTKMDRDPNFPITEKGTFVLKDIEGNKPGIRNNAIVSKSIVNDLVKAAAKEGVPMEDALATAMRESGIGSHKLSKADADKMTHYSPWEIMMSHNANTVEGYPLSPDRWRLQRGTVPKHQIIKTKEGITFDPSGLGDTNAKKDYEEYNKYIESFQLDPVLDEPFRKDMRFLKSNLGQKYNPGEESREAKLEREKQVLRANPALYNYADSAYKANIPKLASQRQGGLLRKK